MKKKKYLYLFGIGLLLFGFFSDVLRGKPILIGYRQLVIIILGILLIFIGFILGNFHSQIFLKKLSLRVSQTASAKKISILLSVLFFIVITALAIFPIKFLWEYYSYPYPFEIRDAAGVSTAFSFSSGNNPYTLQNFPENIYLYGFMYPLLLSPFIHIGDKPILVTKYVDIVFLILFLYFTYKFLRKRGASIASILTGLLILLGSIANVYTRNGARPDVTGMFFAYSGFYIVFREKLTKIEVVLSALLCVVAFYFKIYMVFIAPIIAIYLFLYRSKGKSILFILAGIFFALISHLVLRIVLPTHYDITMTQFFSDISYTSSWMIRQTQFFFNYYWILLIMYLLNLSIVVFTLVSAFLKQKISQKNSTIFRSSIIDSQGFHFDIFDIGILVTALVLTVSMGGHKGNFYVYYAHLLLPFLVFKVILIIDQVIKINSLRCIVNMLILAAIVYPFSQTYQVDFKSRSKKMEHLWQLAGSCSNIYEQNPTLAVFKLERKMSPIYDDGQNFYAGQVNTYTKTLFGGISVYSTKEYLSQLEKWNEKIQQGIENQEFDCIFSSEFQEIEGYREAGRVIQGVRGHDVIKFVPD